jgi:hypothetical protein
MRIFKILLTPTFQPDRGDNSLQQEAGRRFWNFDGDCDRSGIGTQLGFPDAQIGRID